MLLHLAKLYFIYFLCLTIGNCCENQWDLVSPAVHPGTLISFKNTTVLGKYEILSWTWIADKGVTWTSKIQNSLTEDKMKGGFVYRKFSQNGKTVVMITWKSDRKNLTWNIDGNAEINQAGWKISVPNVKEWEFIPMSDDKWIFKIGNIEIPNSPITETYESEETVEVPMRLTHLFRKKRSDKFDDFPTTETSSMDYKNTNNSDYHRNWFQKIMDFFFAEGNEARGVEDGIFVRAGKWMKSIACRINGPCNNGQDPSPDIPPTLPEQPNISSSSTQSPRETEAPAEEKQSNDV